jgi:hypothetical protein
MSTPPWRLIDVRRLLPLLLLGCARSFEDDLAEIRAERIRIEGQLQVADTAPIWVTEGEHAFPKFVKDDDSHLPSFVYDHIAKKLRAFSADEIRGQTQEGFGHARCLEMPAAFRGRFWRVTGTVARIWVEPVPGGPVPELYGCVFYPERGAPVLVHLLEKPDILELYRDTVEIDGIFVKLLTYASEGREVAVPFFMAKTMRKLM